MKNNQIKYWVAAVFLSFGIMFFVSNANAWRQIENDNTSLEEIDQTKLTDIIVFVGMIGANQYDGVSQENIARTYAPMVDRLFTHRELKEIIYFGRTPVGQKFFRDMREGALITGLTDREKLTYQVFMKSPLGKKYLKLFDIAFNTFEQDWQQQ